MVVFASGWKIIQDFQKRGAEDAGFDCLFAFGEKILLNGESARTEFSGLTKCTKRAETDKYNKFGKYGKTDKFGKYDKYGKNDKA